MKPVPITFNSVTRKEERVAQVCHQWKDFWVGSGFVNKRKTTSPRRFLRVRNEDGICRYFFWTDPRRGEQVPCVFGFRKRVKISLEKAKKHYEKQ